MVNAKRSINQALPIRYLWERVHERFGAGSFPEEEGFPLCHGNAFMRRFGLPDADRDFPKAWLPWPIPLQCRVAGSLDARGSGLRRARPGCAWCPAEGLRAVRTAVI